MARDPIAGPDSGPEVPFPIQLRGRIVKGFGRGSKELGIPTANLPLSGLSIGGHDDIDSGVYYGWASINKRGAVGVADAAPAPAPGQEDVKKATDEASAKSDNALSNETPFTDADAAAAASDKAADKGQGEEEYEIYPTVLSIGYNPFYKNSVRSVEVHVMHEFQNDFYNAMMNLSILGFIRPEKDYDSMDALIEDIKEDIEVARRSLERKAYEERKGDGYLADFSWD